MDQPDHAERNGNRDPGPHQRTVTGREFDVLGAVEINAGVAVVGTSGQRKPGVKTHNRQTGRHGGTDYP
jgi:hypothetical protein